MFKESSTKENKTSVKSKMPVNDDANGNLRKSSKNASSKKASSSTSTNKQPQKQLKRFKDESDDDVDSSSESDSIVDESDDEEEEEVLCKQRKFYKIQAPSLVKLPMSFMVDENEYSDEWETESEYETENEDEPISSSEDENEEDSESMDDVPMDSNNPVITQLLQMSTSQPENAVLKKCLKSCASIVASDNQKTQRKIQKSKERNSRIFSHLMHDKHAMRDTEYFEELSVEEQVKLIKEMREVNKIVRAEKPYRMTILESSLSPHIKSIAIQKLNTLYDMEPGHSEYFKAKGWIDTFMRIPFSTYHKIPVSLDDGLEACNDFMEKAQQTLDSAVYGMDNAKMQILQLIGQLITNPSAVGSAIAIQGPPGTGKTSLVKEGISKILNRPFAFIPLGGATDSSFLEGHGYAYEGSSWGKIVQILIESKCMNPTIYFDELDKVSDTPRGEEIIGILTHLIDTSQNTQFHDKYFTEIGFDLSKCLFIFSYNDESKVNPILRDRMYRIKTMGYSASEKRVIASNYLLPSIRNQVRFTNEDIIIPEQTIRYIIERHSFESGVRSLKRCLETIYTKLNLFRLTLPKSGLIEKNIKLTVTFPFTVTPSVVDQLIKPQDERNASLYGLYV